MAPLDPHQRPPANLTGHDETLDLERQVRDALHHLYDPVYLATHPLTRFMAAESGRASLGAGKRLRQALLDAIATLRPGPEMAPIAPVARAHQILSLRYVEALAIETVERRLGIGRTEYHRAQRQGWEAITRLLADQWGLTQGPGRDVAGPPTPGDGDGNEAGEITAGTALPAPLTTFVGREREMAAVRRLLESARLVTLTGPPGVGKTRLALAVAAGIQERFSDGVGFVALAPVRDPDLVVAAIAEALGVPDRGGRPLRERLRAALGQRRLLLVLDNFEHVVGAAPLVPDLLDACPRLTVLITSRTVLHVSGEREFAVPPLTLPDPTGPTVPDRLETAEAVELFVERARVARPDFALTAATALVVADVCRMLDGLPLAIELAAARVKALPPPMLLARLSPRLPLLTGGARDLPARHRTLRAAIAWSYDLLSAPEQALLGRLGVFVGGWTLEAAESVCGATGDLPNDVLDELAALVDQSLVQADEGSDGEPRYTMLETIREYALERLEQGGEAEAIQRRHAAYYLAMAERGDTPYMALLQQGGPAEEGAWLDRLEAEHDNLRAALHRFLERAAAEEGLRLAGALTEFWHRRAYWTEGRRWLERALALPGAEERPWPRATALLGAGTLALFLGDFIPARGLLEESVGCWRATGDQRGLAIALARLGSVIYMPKSPAARPLFAESLALFREVGDQRGVADVLRSLGYIATDSGDYAEARALLLDSVNIWEKLGDRAGATGPVHLLGYLAMVQGDNATARTLYERCLAEYRAQGAKRGIAINLYHLSKLADREGNHARAAALCEEALALARELGDKDSVAATLGHLGEAVRHQGDEQRAVALFRESLALRAQVKHTMGMVICLCELAEGAMLAGRLGRAARLFAAAQMLRDTCDAPPAVYVLYYDQVVVDRHVAALRTALGEAAFAAAWAAGQAMSLEQAIAEALDEDVRV